ncbi:MAG: helix-hairpin-helix domain-containing protein [Prosthecobacter sp.]|nr:helix-hairpin-helix domain-containing protein [Prosthecobacter sp.]
MQQESSPRKSHRSIVAEVPPHEVPWWWQALAFLVFAVVSAIVCNESAVQHRRPAEPAVPARIDINFGSQQQLESLPGIGPVLARAIIAARPFASVEELAHVRGVGLKLLEKLRPLIQAAPGRRTADTW